MTFNPNEPRDKDGKWTAGAGAPALTPYEEESAREYAQSYTEAAKVVCERLGFDPANMKVTTEDKLFELNGASYHYAGSCDLASKTITLYQPNVTLKSVPTVAAHEIGHAKFQTFFTDYQAEYEAMTQATKDVDLDTYMKMNGLLKGEWAERFPLYQKYTEVMMPSITDGFAKSDGITPYSQEWWKSWKEGKANTQQAFHETLAEMTAREYNLGPDFEAESLKFKAAGYSLDTSYGRPDGKLGNTYKIRKWKTTEQVDPTTLPPELQDSFNRLTRGGYGSPLDSSLRFQFPKDPAPEWVALYDAVNDHWRKKYGK